MVKNKNFIFIIFTLILLQITSVLTFANEKIFLTINFINSLKTIETQTLTVDFGTELSAQDLDIPKGYTIASDWRYTASKTEIIDVLIDAIEMKNITIKFNDIQGNNISTQTIKVNKNDVLSENHLQLPSNYYLQEQFDNKIIIEDTVLEVIIGRKNPKKTVTINYTNIEGMLIKNQVIYKWENTLLKKEDLQIPKGYELISSFKEVLIEDDKSLNIILKEEGSEAINITLNISYMNGEIKVGEQILNTLAGTNLSFLDLVIPPNYTLANPFWEMTPLMSQDININVNSINSTNNINISFIDIEGNIVGTQIEQVVSGYILSESNINIPSGYKLISKFEDKIVNSNVDIIIQVVSENLDEKLNIIINFLDGTKKVTTQSLSVLMGSKLTENDLQIPNGYKLAQSSWSFVAKTNNEINIELIKLDDSNLLSVSIEYYDTSNINIGNQALKIEKGDTLTFKDLEIPTGYELLNKFSDKIIETNQTLFILVQKQLLPTDKITLSISYIYDNKIVGNQNLVTVSGISLKLSDLDIPKGYKISNPTWSLTPIASQEILVQVQPDLKSNYQWTLNFLREYNLSPIANQQIGNFIAGENYDIYTQLDINGFKLNRVEINGIPSTLPSNNKITINNIEAKDYKIDFYYKDITPPKASAKNNLEVGLYEDIRANQLVENVSDNSGSDISIYYKSGYELKTDKAGKQTATVIVEDQEGNFIEVKVNVNVTEDITYTIKIEFRDEQDDIVGTQKLYAEPNEKFTKKDLKIPSGYSMLENTWTYTAKGNKTVTIDVELIGDILIKINYIENHTDKLISEEELYVDKGYTITLKDLEIPDGYKPIETKFKHTVNKAETLELELVAIKQIILNISYFYNNSKVDNQVLGLDNPKIITEKDLKIPNGYKLTNPFTMKVNISSDISINLDLNNNDISNKASISPGYKKNYYIAYTEAGKLYTEIGIERKCKIIEVTFMDIISNPVGYEIVELLKETDTYRVILINSSNIQVNNPNSSSVIDLTLSGITLENIKVKPNDVKLAQINKDGSYIYIDSDSNVYVNHNTTLQHSSYINIFENNEFKPNGNVTRAEFCTILYNILTDGKYKSNSAKRYFDLDESNLAFNAISYATDTGLVNGYPDGKFYPSNDLTKAEWAKIAEHFVSYYNLPSYSKSLKDVSNNHWAYKSIKEVQKRGYMDASSEGIFEPDKGITRLELVTATNKILSRYPAIRIDNNLIDIDKINPNYYDVSEAILEHRH